MVIQESRLARQLGLVRDWATKFNGKGCIQAVTGFGKTYIAILLIKKLNKNNPNDNSIVIVPSENLYNDWTDRVKGHIAVHDLKNVEVYIINSFIKIQGVIDAKLLILDEYHTYAAPTFSKLFDICNFKWLLGLTATLERLDGKHDMLEKIAPVVDTVGFEESKVNNWISRFKVFNFGIEADIENDIEYQKANKKFNHNFGMFQCSFELMLACGIGDNKRFGVKFRPHSDELAPSNSLLFEIRTKTGKQWREWYANSMGWRGENSHPYCPSALFSYSVLGRQGMKERKLFIYRHPKKIEIIKQITDRLQKQAILFGEDSQIADEIENVLGEKCRAYHSKIKSVTRRIEVVKVFKKKPTEVHYKTIKLGPTKLKREILEDYENKKFQVLSTVRALDEGYNVKGIELVIQHSFNSSKRQDVQRKGRGLRYDEENPYKVAIIINLFIRGSQEEKWLKAKQDGVLGAINVRSVDELIARI
jgi:superfamily II DNA or RNA helicase